jgi:hypothetical protein
MPRSARRLPRTGRPRISGCASWRPERKFGFQESVIAAAPNCRDVDAVSIAFVYCDVVFTDKEARNALLASRELRPLSTFVPRRADELAEWLDALPVVVAPEMLVPHPLRRPLS